MTPQEFAAKIKAKYPAYQGIDDVTLAQKVVEKYPVYKDQVNFSDPGKIKNPYGAAGEALSAFSTGVAKGGLSTARSLGELGDIALSQTVGRGVNALSGKGFVPTERQPIYDPSTSLGQKAKEFITPQGTAENVGFIAEKAGEFLVPSGIVGAGEKAIDAGITGKGALSALGRIGAKAGLEGLASGTVALAQTADPREALKTGLTAGAIRGTTATAGEILQKLPSWFVKASLPKLKEGNIDYALENTKLGSTETMLKKSEEAVKSYSQQVQGILNHPQYAEDLGAYDHSLQETSKAFPNSVKANTPEKVAALIKAVAPKNASIVDDILNGEGTLAEKNILRQELDAATSKRFIGDSPKLTFAKEVAAKMADLLRNEVQSFASETSSIFENFAKEINLRNALQDVADSKILKPNFSDLTKAFGGGIGGGIAGGYAGYKTGGLPGAVAGAAGGAIAGKLATGAGAGIAAAKAATTLAENSSLLKSGSDIAKSVLLGSKKKK